MKREGATKYYRATDVAKELGHAPLPWRITDFGDSSSFAAIHIEAHVPIGGGTGMTIAELYHYDSFKEVDVPRSVIEANAQMIIAAVNERELLQQTLVGISLLARAAWQKCVEGDQVSAATFAEIEQAATNAIKHKGPSE